MMSESAVDPEKSLDLLWQRVRQRGDLPGFSKVVGAILGAMRGEDANEFNMTRTVLSDPTLTQKVLRLANSPMYSVFGQNISTVSEAVMVLGTESIGHLALGLKLVDGLAVASSDSSMARNEMEKAVLAGLIGRQVASAASARDAEQAVVCSMLHGLGRMMVAFYLSETWKVIQRECGGDSAAEDAASQRLLGLGLDAVGRAVALRWGLPSTLVDTLTDVAPQVSDEPLNHNDWLAAVSTMSSRCAEVLFKEAPGSTALPPALARLAKDYAGMLGVEAAQLLTAVQTARKAGGEEATPARPSAKAGAARSGAAALQNGKPANAAQLLSRGVAEMEELLKTASTAQMMSLALETLFKSLGFSHAAAFQRVQKDARYVARMCLGNGLQEVVQRLTFDDAYQPDVFHAALANDKMVFVDNARDPSFINKLPRWWKDAVPSARSFVVMPLTVNRLPMGFLYGDWDVTVASSKIDNAEVTPLNEIRALLVRALDSQRMVEMGWRGQR
jgi:HD-like signal output (HDOD) protein